MSKANLTESEEILLGKFFDGEASLLERIKVRWLLDRNSNAVAYLEQLESTNSLLRKMFVAPEVSLWGQVSANIHRAERELKQNKPTFLDTPSKYAPSLWQTLLPSPIRYGLAGAVAASTVFFIMPVTKSVSGIEMNFRSGLNSVSSSPVVVQDARNVGWIRSSGKAERLNNQSGRSPVVFIKRKLSRNDSLPLLAERNSEGIVIQGNR